MKNLRWISVCLAWIAAVLLGVFANPWLGLCAVIGAVAATNTVATSDAIDRARGEGSRK